MMVFISKEELHVSAYSSHLQVLTIVVFFDEIHRTISSLVSYVYTLRNPLVLPFRTTCWTVREVYIS